MERSKRDLETLVASQKEQLARYEKRLKDVVTAYKGLLKEKEALETSLAALTVSNPEGSVQSSTSPPTTRPNASVSEDVKDDNEKTVKETGGREKTPTVESATTSDDRGQLQTQIITLMNSLATLSAEKSRMEASFQADKKQLRAQLGQKSQSIADLQATIKSNEERAKLHLEEVKSKWIIECQEREKETNNQMVMIRELQKLYADERHLKENIEMQLNNFKTQFANNEAENTRVRELQTQLKEAKAQLKQLQAANSKQQADDDDIESDNAVVLRQVQQEMQQLKEQHAIAIKNEQKRVLHAEEQSRRQAALHEDRVANLEARLAELSSTVGSYDRLRQQDQESIQTLRRKLHELERNTEPIGVASTLSSRELEAEQRRRKLSNAPHDVVTLVDEIVQLKKKLMLENARAANPIDVSKVFAIGADHVQCQEDLNRVQQQYESCQSELTQAQEKLQVQKSHISTLQEKVKVLNRNIDEQELELKQQSEKLLQKVKEERNKWKSILAETENEQRSKVMDLEQQLQKQRQRSLQLLEEKEQELKTLQTSFEVFHNVTMPQSVADASADMNAATSASDAESNEGAGNGNGNARKSYIKAKKLSVGENCHMLHYANEIARKDIEITGLRKAKYSAEFALRTAIQEKVTAQEELCDKIATLEEQVDRLERCKTREGANLEYLKNVIISFIMTRDPDGKRHMLNAISAVLQFTPIEIQTINTAFHKK